MENLSVEQLKAMSPEEVAKLTPQQKATRTKMINAAKDATPASGALKNDILSKAAQENAGKGNTKGPDTPPAATKPPVAPPAEQAPATPPAPQGTTPPPTPPADEQGNNPPADNQNSGLDTPPSAATGTAPAASESLEGKNIIEVPVNTIIPDVNNPGADQGATGNGPGNSPETLEALNLRLQNEAIEAEEAEEKRLIDKHGPGFIRATNGSQSTIFSATAWNMLGKDKNGWRPQVKEPTEVTNFKNKGGN